MNDFNDTFPYPSQRMPVMARNVVATSQPLAAQAGLRMLHAGGNAVDAAIAAAATLTVVEPTSNGIGSDAFAILWDGERLHALNASGRSPKALSPERFSGQKLMPLRGWDAVTVPGAVSAWVALQQRFGSLPLETLLEPAISYAESGFAVSPITARAWRRAPETFRDFPDFAAAFLPDGRAPHPGELFRHPEQAHTLARIAETAGETFYRGELAERMAACSAETGGLLTEADLAEHRADWVETISTDYHSTRLHEIPPNGQGLAALIALGILRHRPEADAHPDSADGLHVTIEAMKLGFADAHRYISDPDTMDVSVPDLLDDGYLAERAARIDMEHAADPQHGVPSRGGTVYLTTADAQGRMVSMIQSNYHGFGSGIVVPGTGISLQNRGAGFVLEPGHPNRVGGGKRPFHTIIPGFVTRGGAPLMGFGVMGGPMQPQGHVQMMVRIFGAGQNPQAASDAPRWRVMEGRMVALERGFVPEVLNELKVRGHELQLSVSDTSFAFGGAQLILRTEAGFVAASDHRKDGQAVGY